MFEGIRFVFGNVTLGITSQKDRFYRKVDGLNANIFENAGNNPFKSDIGSPKYKSYYEDPVQVAKDQEDLFTWEFLPSRFTRHQEEKQRT